MEQGSPSFSLKGSGQLHSLLQQIQLGHNFLHGGRHQSQQHCCTSAIHVVERMKMINCIVAAQI